MDLGTEYGGNKIKDFVKLQGAVLELLSPLTPKQNRVAESINKKVNVAIRCISLYYNVLGFLWPELYYRVIYTINRMTYRGLVDLTPFEAVQISLNNIETTKLDILHLRALGCRAYVYL